jgi:hypothetical protein
MTGVHHVNMIKKGNPKPVGSFDIEAYDIFAGGRSVFMARIYEFLMHAEEGDFVMIETDTPE